MNLLYIFSDISKSVHFEHLVLGMRDKGFNISVILFNGKDTEFDDFLKTHKFPVYYIQATSFLKSWSKLFTCLKIMKTINPDVVHTHLQFADWFGLWASWLLGVKKRIYTRHNGPSLIIKKKERAIDYIQNKLATDIVAISLNIQDYLLSQGDIKSKITLIHHGFDIHRYANPDLSEVQRIKQQYNPNGKFPIIGVISRWVEWKGIQYIIPAFARLLNDYPNAKLCMYNVDKELPYGKKILELLNNIPKDSFELTNFENNSYDLYQLFDIYIHTPINEKCEAFGQTYIESLGAGVSTIFTLSGVAREITLPNKKVHIVPFKDSDAIYYACLEILSQKHIENSTIEKEQETVFDLFKLEKHIEKHQLLYLQP